MPRHADDVEGHPEATPHPGSGHRQGDGDAPSPLEHAVEVGVGRVVVGPAVTGQAAVPDGGRHRGLGAGRPGPGGQLVEGPLGGDEVGVGLRRKPDQQRRGLDVHLVGRAGDDLGEAVDGIHRAHRTGPGAAATGR